MEDNAIAKLIADEKELTRQGVILDNVQKQMGQLVTKFDQLNEKVDNKYVTRQEYDLRMRQIDELFGKLATKEEMGTLANDITAIKDSSKWVVRLVIGAVILALLGLLVAPHINL